MSGFLQSNQLDSSVSRKLIGLKFQKLATIGLQQLNQSLSKILSLRRKIQVRENPYSEETRIQRKSTFKGNPYSEDTCIQRKHIFQYFMLSWVIFLLQTSKDFYGCMLDPGSIVIEPKLGSMELYSIFANRMVIVQEKKTVTA